MLHSINAQCVARGSKTIAPVSLERACCAFQYGYHYHHYHRHYHFVNVNVILNFKRDTVCASLWNRYQRKTLFVIDVSINWTTVRRWQTKLLDTWKVTQIHLLRQKVADQTSWSMEGNSDIFTLSEGGRPNLIHGRQLRYIYYVRRWQTKLDPWKVTQIYLLCQKVADQTSWSMEGNSDTFTSSEGGRPNFLIHGR